MTQYLPDWFLYLIAGAIGAVLGSFANVCIVRLPRDKSVVWPPSHCPHCERRLVWWENIPVFSFLFLSGRCRTCKGPIALRYPIVEALCVILSLYLWWFYKEPFAFLIYLSLFVIPLVIVSFIDLEHMIIPDVISVPGILVGVGVNVLFAAKGNRLSAGLDSLIGAAVGGGALYLVAFAYEKIKKIEGLGGGDVKLMAMLGAFFGWREAIFILFLSSIIGAIVGLIVVIVQKRDMKYAIPFGPFLAMAGLINLLMGDYIMRHYFIILGYVTIQVP